MVEVGSRMIALLFYKALNLALERSILWMNSASSFDQKVVKEVVVHLCNAFTVIVILPLFSIFARDAIL